MQFSQRTDWPLRHNRLTELLELRQSEGLPVLDLTLSNPTSCGLAASGSEIRDALSDPEILLYAPDPRGRIAAREAVCAYYRGKSVHLDPAHLFLTASTSEAYGYALNLLCDPGDSVLAPTPSYPLFEYLAQMHGVVLGQYRLQYDQGWRVDIGSVERAITEATRAIILIHPHNPTGAFLRNEEYRMISRIASDRGLALIVDEVFSEYGFSQGGDRFLTAAGDDRQLTLTLNGLSKLAGLPQMKLGWMIVSGPEDLRRTACERLETISDTYLSVNTPAQVALPKILAGHASITGEILRRVAGNYRLLRSLCTQGSHCTALDAEGGWYGILRLPKIQSDEEWALKLLEKRGILLFPGYFFDMEGCYLAVSLLAEPGIFQEGVRGVLEFVGESISPSLR